MENCDEILRQYLSEQIALEEHLSKIINEQIAEIDEVEFADAKNLLIKTNQVLERHFTPLNELLDKLENDALIARTQPITSNGRGGEHHPPHLEQRKRRISRILRDDYSALNLIAISNTLLHTTALALDCQDVATLALKHLENLAPLVIRIRELVPEVVAKELHAQSPNVDLKAALTALKNTQLVWGKSS